MRTTVMLTAALALTACGGSMSTAQASESAASTAAQRSYDVRGFDRVSALGPHRVVVSVGPAFSVRAHGPSATLDRTEVVVEDGELQIRPRKDKRGNHEWRDYEGATFEVTLPRLVAAGMVGSGTMTVDRVAGEDFAGSVAGSGTLELADLAVDEADLSVAGSGDLVAHGRAQRAQASVAGSGNLQAKGLTSGSASVSVAGSGDAALTVTGEAQVSIVGSGDVEVAGSAHCTVSRIGSGKLSCASTERETEISLR